MEYYVEMTVEDAMKKCKEHTKVLVAVQDLENDEDDDIMFVKKKRDEYDELFTDAKTAISSYDNFIKQLNLFTVKQDIYNIKPKGKRKIILLK